MNAQERPACITARVITARWSSRVGFSMTRGIRSVGVGRLGMRTGGGCLAIVFLAVGFFAAVFLAAGLFAVVFFAGGTAAIAGRQEVGSHFGFAQRDTGVPRRARDDGRRIRAGGMTEGS